MKEFLENTVVVTWIAPIITGIVVIIITTLFGKIISIWWKNRAFIRKVESANEKYINNVLPYMIQEIEVDAKMLYSIKKAITIEYNVAEKYLYTNEQICNLIILNISNTRFLTEINKARLINNVLEIFGRIGNSIIREEEKETKVKISKRYPLATFVIGIVFSLVVYCISPEKIDDPNSLVQLLIIFGMLVSISSILFLWLSILSESDKQLSIDIIDAGLFGSTFSAMSAILMTINEVLFGKKPEKRESKKDISDDKKSLP